MTDQPKLVKDPLTKAGDDMAEKITVVGWKEMFQETITWIRRVFQLAVFLCSCFCVYYCFHTIRKFVYSGYTDAIEDVADAEALPFSNVTVCAQVYLNETFVRENIKIPENVLEHYKKDQGRSVDYLYEQLTLFLVQTTRPKNINPALLIYFSQILRQNPRVNDLSAFTIAALPTCESMLKRCWLAGKEFDCCNRTVQAFDGDGICYLVALNFDSDNAAPSHSTWHQTEPGPSGGLTVEASLDLKGFLWVDDVASNGFSVYVGATPFGEVQSPQLAPHNAETFVKVIPSKHLLSTNCAPRGHLSMKVDNFMYYDPEGFTCMYSVYESVVYKYFSCHSPLPLYRPNSSIACSPQKIFIVQSYGTQNTLMNMLQSARERHLQAAEVIIPEARVKKMQTDVEHDIKATLSAHAFCPSHCSYWTYSSSASFFYLEKPGENESCNQDKMFSKMHVYYGDLRYRQYNQVQESTVYLAFCDFGNVVGLYWGMSIVSFFQVFFYVPRYLYLLWKSRKQRTRVSPVSSIVKTITVAPAVQMAVTKC